MQAEKCLVCDNITGNKIVRTREMMLGLRTEFDYLECTDCGCLHLINQPEDLENYYPKNYYSFKTDDNAAHAGLLPDIKRKVKSMLMDAYLNDENLLGRIVSPKYKNFYPWLRKKTVSTRSRILDIGCGTGELLQTMYNDGFKHLTGLDPYIDHEIHYGSGIRIHKKNPEDLNDRFDFIMMHHAFEHMGNPLEILQKMHNLLNDGGYLIIRIPVADSFAWNKYRENWVQLDAPRHIFLHTKKSMKILSKATGFAITDISYDSYELQFVGSEKYIKNIPLSDDKAIFSEDEILKFRQEASHLNETKNGDQACFYLKKI